MLVCPYERPPPCTNLPGTSLRFPDAAPLWHCPPPERPLTPISTAPCGSGEVATGAKGASALQACQPLVARASGSSGQAGDLTLCPSGFFKLGASFLGNKTHTAGLGHDLRHSRGTAGVLRPEAGEGRGLVVFQWPPTQLHVSETSTPPTLQNFFLTNFLPLLSVIYLSINSSINVSIQTGPGL